MKYVSQSKKRLAQIDEAADAQVPTNVHDLWMVSNRVAPSPNIEDVYGVVLEAEKESNADENLGNPTL